MANNRKTTKRNTNQGFRNELRFQCGIYCANCGSSENIEYHHIVPLLLGGNDIASNIVPLCHACHKAAHTGRNITNYLKETGRTSGGRPPKIPDEEAFKVYDLWLDGQFGNKKCRELLHLKEGTYPNQTQQFKRFIAARGIKSVRNNYDLNVTLRAKRVVDGAIIGQIYYLDGTSKPIKVHDTGLNDDVVYEFCTRKDRSIRYSKTWGKRKAIRTRKPVLIHKKEKEMSRLSAEFFDTADKLQEPQQTEIMPGISIGMFDSHFERIFPTQEKQ